MIFLFKGYQIDYEYIYNNKDETVLFLHGWGGNKDSFISLEKYLAFNHNILKLSFPPYFTSTNKNLQSVLPLTIFDYKDIVLSILKLHNIKNVTIICHSFGFRITLLLTASKINIKKIIVTGGAGIKLKTNLLKTIILNSKILFSKKKILNLTNDYSVLNNVDKQTFKNIVNENLINYTHLIKCPTLLFWGEKDTDTPIKICKFLNKTLKDKDVQIVKSDHFAYLKENTKFIHASLNFLNK